jgi:acyl phosphate:glycerol-3-phosphate acyltransferase
MEIFYITICGISAYLLGSIPTAVWYGTGFHGIDIREHGSKNAGATNTFRVLGKKAGIIVLIIDVLKGWVATSLALGLYYLHVISNNAMEDWKLAFGVLAVVGHLFPIFSNFRGGKGVATLCGMLLSINAIAGICNFSFRFVKFHIGGIYFSIVNDYTNIWKRKAINHYFCHSNIYFGSVYAS